jgi:uncharacterized membrane protein
MTDLLLTIHVLGAVIWVGGSVLALTLGYYLRRRDISTRVEYTRWTEWLGPRLFAPMSIAVIVAGHLLVNEIGYDFDQTWLHIGQAGWLLSFVIGIAFYPREGKKRERLIEQHGVEHDSVAASINRVLTVATVDTLIVVGVVIDMTTKPGLG